MPSPSTTASQDFRLARKFRVRYLILTIGFFAPLIWAFAFTRNLYPIASWTVMMGGGQLHHSSTYFVLRGETASGQTIDIPAVTLTDAMRSRLWGLVSATANNDSFRLRSLHPKNGAVLAAAGGVEHLPDGLLMKDLLRAWGDIYNAQHPSAFRLKAIRLDCYQWPGGQYSNYDQFVKSWREEL